VAARGRVGDALGRLGLHGAGRASTSTPRRTSSRSTASCGPTRPSSARRCLRSMGNGRPLVRFANSLNSGAASWGYYPEGHLWVAINDWIRLPDVRHRWRRAGRCTRLGTRIGSPLSPGAYAPALSPDPATRGLLLSGGAGARQSTSAPRSLWCGSSVPWEARSASRAEWESIRNSGAQSAGKVLTQGPRRPAGSTTTSTPVVVRVLAGDEGLAFSATRAAPLCGWAGRVKAKAPAWLLESRGNHGRVATLLDARRGEGLPSVHRGLSARGPLGLLPGWR
jgi:hypothetical protein